MSSMCKDSGDERTTGNTDRDAPVNWLGYGDIPITLDTVPDIALRKVKPKMDIVVIALLLLWSGH
jgi:hypothetical protein